MKYRKREARQDGEPAAFLCVYGLSNVCFFDIILKKQKLVPSLLIERLAGGEITTEREGNHLLWVRTVCKSMNPLKITSNPS